MSKLFFDWIVVYQSPWESSVFYLKVFYLKVNMAGHTMHSIQFLCRINLSGSDIFMNSNIVSCLALFIFCIQQF